MICWYPDFADQVLHGLYVKIQPSLAKFLEGAGHLPDWDVVLMQTAYNIEPAFLSPARLIECVPYVRPESFAERMEATVQRGWLYEINGGFSLTDAGREIVVGMYELRDRLFAKIEALPEPKMARLLLLSDRVIAKIKELPAPAKKPAFELSMQFTRGASTPLIVQVRQRTLVLLSFRDDAHVAAWRPFTADGQLWESFTLVWREQAGSAGELAEQLAHRNYTKDDYARALEKLRTRGWITYQGCRFIPLVEAHLMRQQVEHTTDEVFAAAFGGLSPDEMREFQKLMEQLAASVAPHKKR